MRFGCKTFLSAPTAAVATGDLGTSENFAKVVIAQTNFGGSRLVLVIPFLPSTAPTYHAQGKLGK